MVYIALVRVSWADWAMWSCHAIHHPSLLPLSVPACTSTPFLYPAHRQYPVIFHPSFPSSSSIISAPSSASSAGNPAVMADEVSNILHGIAGPPYKLPPQPAPHRDRYRTSLTRDDLYDEDDDEYCYGQHFDVDEFGQWHWWPVEIDY